MQVNKKQGVMAVILQYILITLLYLEKIKIQLMCYVFLSKYALHSFNLPTLYFEPVCRHYTLSIYFFLQTVTFINLSLLKKSINITAYCKPLK